MKKLASMFLCIAMLITLFGCAPTERDLTEDEHAAVEEIFTTLCTTFNVEEIDFPNVRIVSSKKIVEISGKSASTAVYDNETRTVYIRDTTSEYSEALIAHELIHYINHFSSGFPEKYGFDYKKSEDFELGFYLTEGITQYFSSKVYPMPETYTAYPFESMIAEQMAALFGEEELYKLFMTSDVETLRKKFNILAFEAGLQNQEPWEDGIIMTPFDSFSYFVDSFSDAYYTGNLQYQQNARSVCSVCHAIAKQNYKLDKFEEILRTFVKRYAGTFGFLYA